MEITYTISGRDNTDVGAGDANDIDEWWISDVNGRTSKSYDWIYNRLSRSDEEQIIEECYENQNY